MIEFLPYGNVTVAALILAAVLLAAVLVNQVALLVGRIALSLDDENAPKMLERNWLWDMIKKCVPTNSNLRKVEGGWGLTSGYGICGREFYDANGGNYLSWIKEGGTLRDHGTFSTKESALSSDKYQDIWVDHTDVLYVGATLLLVDLAILWLQHHFLSAAWVLSTVGIVLTLRFITGKLWNHNKRITTLEEK